uniref:Nuclear receptor domain-containing protein n=1 Tax=Ditylenchus dipsaci TaxID=166011 RepID=A0A915E864_9BILA
MNSSSTNFMLTNPYTCLNATRLQNYYYSLLSNFNPGLPVGLLPPPPSALALQSQNKQWLGQASLTLPTISSSTLASGMDWTAALLPSKTGQSAFEPVLPASLFTPEKNSLTPCWTNESNSFGSIKAEKAESSAGVSPLSSCSPSHNCLSPNGCSSCSPPTTSNPQQLLQQSGCNEVVDFKPKSILASKPYACKYKGQCDITTQRCRACRLATCLKVGMNPRAMHYTDPIKVEKFIGELNQKIKKQEEERKKKTQLHKHLQLEMPILMACF